MPPKALVLLFLFSSAYADCPVWAVYDRRFGKCYEFYTQPATFLTAEKNCESDGGSLVSIGNAYENTFVSGIAAQSYSDTYWTGMNLLMSTQWSWTSGSNATYFNWAPDQPNDSSAYLCGAARTSDNQWTKELCSTKKPYMCQFDPHNAGVTPGACPWGYCPGANYTLNNNACKCYKYFFTPMNYKDAAETCTNEGATLAIVLSKAENYFLSNFAYKSLQNPMPLGDIPLWEWCWMGLAVISALMHCAVLVTIVNARRRKFNSILKAPFFTIIFIQGIHELLELGTTNGFNRLRKYQIIPYALQKENKVVEYQFYWYCFLKSLMYLGHVEIAVNRLSAVTLTKYKRYDELWKTKNIILLNIVGYLILAGLRVIIYRIFFSDLIVTTYISPGSVYFSFSMSPGDAADFENSADIVLSLGTGIICIVCYGITSIIQRKHGYSSPRAKKQETTLLRIGLITFLILLPTTIRSGLEFWSSVTNQKDFLAFITRWNTIPAEAMCIVQPWLLVLSCRTLRDSMFSRTTTVSTTLTLSSK